MHPHCNKYARQNQEFEVLHELEILSDKDKNGKERPYQEHKISTIDLAGSLKRIKSPKFYRVQECGTYLTYKKHIQTGEKKLKQANFCKVRLCPMCIWRRSLKIFGQVSKVMDRALESKEYRFIFLTLTCRNVEGFELSETLDKLFKGFDRLFKRTSVKKAVKGWFRGLEITHNLDQESKDYDTYHPHFHVILMVNKSYFTEKTQYISQEQWTEFWKESLQVDYPPIVHIQAFRSGSKKQTAKGIAESAKYTVKDNDYLIPNDEAMTDSAVMVLDGALANRRLVAFGGDLKKIHKDLNLDDTESGDLVNTDNEEEQREDVNYVLEHYRWHVGYKQYYKTK